MIYYSDRESIFEIIKKCYIDLYDNTEIANKLSMKASKAKNSTGVSILIFKQSAFKITFHKDCCKMVLKPMYKKLIPDTLKIKHLKNSIVVYVDNVSDFSCFSELYEKLFEDLSSQNIGCCSRYVECSDALQCVNNNVDIFPYCAYRRNLRNGKVFYGKNKNI